MRKMQSKRSMENMRNLKRRCYHREKEEEVESKKGPTTRSHAILEQQELERSMELRRRSKIQRFKQH